MKILHRLFRLVRINFILMRYNIAEIFLENNLFSPFRFIIYFNPYFYFKKNKLPRGLRLRLAIEELGPIFVKAGQVLSTRRDILPDDIATELAKLQDRVPPFSGTLAKKMIEASLECNLSQVFLEFDINALASASIAQVHAGTLRNGDDIVVKVLRPNIKNIIDCDIDILMTCAKGAERYWKHAQYLKPVEIVNEIAQTLYDELDLLREGANASQLNRHFNQSPHLKIPKIYWQHSRTNILVMERIYGIPIHDITKLQETGFDMPELAKGLIEIFFTQVFRDNFFHADLHPGNLFVSTNNIHTPSFIAVDFGIVGSLNQHDQRYLAENLLAFFKRDYQRVAELHVACGWIPPDTRVDQFESAIRAVSEPILEQPFAEISFGLLLMRLFQVARRFHINIQPQLILLQKSLVNIEGLSRALAPHIDLWGIATPQIEKWIKKQIGFKAFLGRLKKNLPLLSEQLPELPTLIFEVLNEEKFKNEKLRFRNQEKQDIKSHQQHKLRNTKLTYFFAGIIVTLLFTLIIYRI